MITTHTGSDNNLDFKFHTGISVERKETNKIFIVEFDWIEQTWKATDKTTNTVEFGESPIFALQKLTELLRGNSLH